MSHIPPPNNKEPSYLEPYSSDDPLKRKKPLSAFHYERKQEKKEEKLEKKFKKEIEQASEPESESSSTPVGIKRILSPVDQEKIPSRPQPRTPQYPQYSNTPTAPNLPLTPTGPAPLTPIGPVAPKTPTGPAPLTPTGPIPLTPIGSNTPLTPTGPAPLAPTGPVAPRTPTGPAPLTPTGPVAPRTPTGPAPLTPTGPVAPRTPTGPAPLAPTGPIPLTPIGSNTPLTPTGPAAPKTPESSEEKPIKKPLLPGEHASMREKKEGPLSSPFDIASRRQAPLGKQAPAPEKQLPMPEKKEGKAAAKEIRQELQEEGGEVVPIQSTTQAPIRTETAIQETQGATGAKPISEIVLSHNDIANIVASICTGQNASGEKITEVRFQTPDGVSHTCTVTQLPDNSINIHIQTPDPAVQATIVQNAAVINENLGNRVPPIQVHKLEASLVDTGGSREYRRVEKSEGGETL